MIPRSKHACGHSLASATDVRPVVRASASASVATSSGAVILAVLSTVTLLACSSADGSDGTPVCNVDTLSEPYAATDVVPRIGRLGDDGFSEFADNEAVRVVSGGQGGEHIDVLLGFDEVVDTAENFPKVRYRLRHEESLEVLAVVDDFIGTVLAERPGATLAMISPRRLVLPNIFPRRGSYQLEVDTVFADCSVASIAKRVYLELPAEPFPPAPPHYPYQRNKQ